MASEFRSNLTWESDQRRRPAVELGRRVAAGANPSWATFVIVISYRAVSVASIAPTATEEIDAPTGKKVSSASIRDARRTASGTFYPVVQRCKECRPGRVLYRSGTVQHLEMTPPEPPFEEVVREHAGDLYRYAFWLARDRQQAEDVVQEALLRGWRAFPRLRDRAAVKTWLFAIVRNEFCRFVAKNVPYADSLDAAELDIADERMGLFGLEMREALMALPVSYAEPLALQVLGGFSCAEIAAMLDTTEGAVMTRLTRARQALRRLVAPAREHWGARA